MAGLGDPLDPGPAAAARAGAPKGRTIRIAAVPRRFLSFARVLA
jgi:hypothetical protein